LVDEDDVLINLEKETLMLKTRTQTWTPELISCQPYQESNVTGSKTENTLPVTQVIIENESPTDTSTKDDLEPVAIMIKPAQVKL